jgi:hypothetical protein
LTYFWDHPKWKLFALTTYTSLPNLGTYGESMWNIRTWPTPDDLKPMNHVSNSSFMRRDYQKCFTYDMYITFHGYMVPNKGVTKRFYICVIIITKKNGPIKIRSKLRHPRNLCTGRTMVMYLCIHDETACWGLKIDFFKKYQPIFHGAAVQI